MRILITGASRGIGFDTAIALAETGHQVLAIARNEKGLQDLVQKSNALSANGSIQYLVMDLETLEIQLVIDAIQAMGGLDVLINNAGLLIKKDFQDLSDSDWQRSFQINLMSPIHIIQACLPFLEKSESAHILNIGSMGGFQGSQKFAGLSAYGITKSAIANLSETLATEFAPLGIHVNCLALGAVQTQMLQEAFPGYKAPVNSSEMGKFIAYFCTFGQHLFNGKILPVSISNP